MGPPEDVLISFSSPLEKVIGSIVITGTAETILVMEQQTGTKDCKLNVTGKDVEQCDKYLSWNGHGFNIDDDVNEAQLGPFQRLVLMLIRETPRCLQKSIVDRTGKDQSQVSKGCCQTKPNTSQSAIISKTYEAQIWYHSLRAVVRFCL